MKKATEPKMRTDSVVIIGGVGGSGTRAVAEVVNSLGVFLGSNLNTALDNLDWPASQCAALIRNQSISYEEKLPEVSAAFRSFSDKMRAEAEAKGGEGAVWGTKVPGSFFYLRYLNEILNGFRYIHVIRHGLDMAFSRNHNQLLNWGEMLDIPAPGGATPRLLLKYWARANTYALQNCRTWLPDRHLVVRFEDVCSDSAACRSRIADFLNLTDIGSGKSNVEDRIFRQESEGRYKKLAQPGMFDECDLLTLKQLGFSAEPF